MTNNLVFLISQPRSGSTLLQAILGSHPGIHTSTEPWIALPFIYALKNEGSEFEFNSSWSNNAIKAFFNESGIDDDFYNFALNSFLTTLYHKSLTNSGKNIFLDKTPRYYEIANDLLKIFPDAKFIVLYRHPLSVLNSILNTWVKENTDCLYNYSRDLLVAPQKLTDFVSRHKKNICLVHYEELVMSPKVQIKRICEYLNVEYLEDIINYKSDKEWAFGDKNFKDRKAPDNNSIDTWKDQLENQRTLNFNYYYLRELGEELVNSLGYNYASIFNQISISNPNDDDLVTWNALLHGKYIISVEEQRRLVKKDLEETFIKALIRRFKS